MVKPKYRGVLITFFPNGELSQWWLVRWSREDILSLLYDTSTGTTLLNQSDLCSSTKICNYPSGREHLKPVLWVGIPIKLFVTRDLGQPYLPLSDSERVLHTFTMPVVVIPVGKHSLHWEPKPKLLKNSFAPCTDKKYCHWRVFKLVEAPFCEKLPVCWSVGALRALRVVLPLCR